MKEKIINYIERLEAKAYQSADYIAHYLHYQYGKQINDGKDISSTISFIEVKLFLP